MHWLDINGNGSYEVIGKRGDDMYAMNMNSVMYDIGKVMTIGGATWYSEPRAHQKKQFMILI